MNKRILEELKDMFEVINNEYIANRVKLSFEEYALPIIAFNLAMRYTPEEVAIFVKDREVRALFKLYASSGGTLQ